MRKTSYEAINVQAKFDKAMTDSETIDDFSVTAVDKDGEDATSTLIENASVTERTRIAFRVKSGTVSGSPYTVSVKGDTSLDQKLEIRGSVEVYCDS